jgi:hypothetical protein
MRTVYSIAIVLAIATAITSCGNETPEPEAQIIPDTPTILPQRYEDTVTQTTMIQRNRTLRQLSFTELIQFLPQDLEGYKMKDTINGEDGSIGKSGNRYYSYASKTFGRKEKRVRVEIVDYSEDSSQFRGMLHMYGFDTSGIDNNVVTTKRINLGIAGTRAVVNQYKQDTASSLIIGAGDRILVIITGIQTKDIDLLKRAAGKINFQKMIRKTRESA